MFIKLKRTHPNAVIPFKDNDSDFCYNVVAVSEKELAPNVWQYGLGFTLQIERDFEILYMDYPRCSDSCLPYEVYFDFKDNSQLNLSLEFRPLNDIWKTGMVLSNCVGTINECCNAEVNAVFYHVLPKMPRYKVGDIIGQIKLGVTFPLEFTEVDGLNETEQLMNR